jgi:hypothetical protein
LRALRQELETSIGELIGAGIVVTDESTGGASPLLFAAQPAVLISTPY